MIRTYPPYQNASFPLIFLNKICPDVHCGSVPSSLPHRAYGSPQHCEARRGSQVFATLCCPPPAISPPSGRPMQLSFMSLCHLSGRNLHPSHQKSLSLSRYLWAEPAAHPSHLLPSPLRPFSLNAISSTHTVAAFPSTSQPLHPAFSVFQMVLLLLTLCIAHQLEKAHGRAVPSTENLPAGLREQPGTTRVNSKVVSVQLLRLITTLDPSQKKTS